ncbi:MAG: homoserine dehydrogenase [Candidatus Woesearchaeota archaeon]
MKTINIGIIGLGVVGSGVIEIIKNNSSILQNRTDIKINVVQVCSRSSDKAKKLGLSKIWTNKYSDIINNPLIDVIVELIGGYNPAYEIIMDSIKAKKHVITANKAVLAKHGYKIFEEAKKNNVNILFEAAIAGCIPIVKAIEESFSSDKISKIYGILNGTTNYILTRMSEGMSYSDALSKAQELGFAESDPTFDVEGMDASQKLLLLSSLAFDAYITESSYVEGITKITSSDLKYANQLGYTIKLIAISKKQDKNIEMRTHPTMIPKNHTFANVNEEINSVLLYGNNIGEISISGKGAGKAPTATVVVSDILEMASRGKITYRKFIKKSLKPMNNIVSRYYLRFNVVERPGVLAEITKILGQNNISISGFWQKEVEKKIVPIVILTHECKEKNMKKAFSLINKLSIVKSSGIMIRIEDL